MEKVEKYIEKAIEEFENVNPSFASTAATDFFKQRKYRLMLDLYSVKAELSKITELSKIKN